MPELEARYRLLDVPYVKNAVGIIGGIEPIVGESKLLRFRVIEGTGILVQSNYPITRGLEFFVNTLDVELLDA